MIDTATIEIEDLEGQKHTLEISKIQFLWEKVLPANDRRKITQVVMDTADGPDEPVIAFCQYTEASDRSGQEWLTDGEAYAWTVTNRYVVDTALSLAELWQLIREASPREFCFGGAWGFVSNPAPVRIRGSSETANAMRRLLKQYADIFDAKQEKINAYAEKHRAVNFGSDAELSRPVFYLPTYDRFKIKLIGDLAGWAQTIKRADDPDRIIQFPDGTYSRHGE